MNGDRDSRDPGESLVGTVADLTCSWGSDWAQVKQARADRLDGLA